MEAVSDIHLKNYILETELDQNSWFTLYQGRRRFDDAAVLIKIAAPHLASDPFFGQRLQHMAKQVSQLEHPNLIQIIEFEQEGDQLYLVYEFVKGQPLSQMLATNGPFTLPRTLLIADQIASALDSAHQKAVMHGSLSAADILIDNRDRVVVANFGENQTIFGPQLSKHPIDIISPETTAPERVNGQGPSRPADLFALGVLCYQMLAGRPPFSGPASTVLHGQAYKQARPLNDVNPGIPIAVSEVVERMMAKGVELRYNTALEFARALAGAARTQKTMRRYDRLVPLVERERPQPMTFKAVFYWLSAVVAVLLVALLSAWTGYELGVRQPAPTASPSNIIVHTTLPTETLTSTLVLPVSVRQTVRLQEGGPAPTISSASNVKLSSDSDTLLSVSQRESLLPTPAPSPTPSPTVAVIAAPAQPEQPAPTPTLVVGPTRLIFHNPTGHDLIIDLTGPTNDTSLVPPGQNREFLLQPGAYQYMLHTPGSKALDSVVGTFDLFQGQTVEKDYYSDYNWNR